MRARVSRTFNGVCDGECYPRAFQLGDEIDGQLGDIAVREGWADPLEKAAAPPEDKALPRAPRNKAK